MSDSARGSKKTGKFSGNARAVVFTSRITKVADSSAVVGSLKSFVPNDLLGSLKDWIEYPEPEEGEVHSTWHSPCATPSEASVGLPELDRDRVRRRVERQGDRLMRQRLACRRHEQLKELVELLPPAPPQLSRAARRAKEKKLREEAERAREEAERLYREARRGYALRRFRAAGFAVLRKLRLGDDDFFAWLNNTAVLPISKRESGKGQEAARQCAEGSEPFHHHLRHVRREELTPRHAARRQELTERGNFSPSFIVGLEVKPRVDAQPLLAFMEQGDFISTVEQKVDSDSEHRILSRRFRALRGREARGDPRAPVEEPTSKAAKRSTKPGEVSVKFAHVVRVGRTKMQRLLELLDPQRAVGHVAADALVPLMFWLGLTKSRTAALETLRMGFGSLQIDLQALLVMGEHVEVQMRLVDGLRQLIRRESLEQLCEYITSNGFQRLRAWFNSMRADQFGCVDITQVQSLFARMEVTTDRQTLFRLLSYIIENPHPTAAKDPSEAIAIEKKKFSLQGFGSLLCRCAASWVLHRVMSMLEAPENNRRPSEQDVAMRWIQLQRRIMISLMVNQRFWGRESRQVLGHLQPPQIAMEEMEALTPEQHLRAVPKSLGQ